MFASKSIRSIAEGAVLALFLGILLISGACNDDVATAPDMNIPPRTQISGGPVPFNNSLYLVDLKWFGEDADGEVSTYEFAWDDTTEWFETVLSGSTFVVRSDSCCVYDTTSEVAGDIITESFFRFHTFFIRAIDNEGLADPTPAFITFNAVTVAPQTTLNRGPGVGASTSSGPSASFEWEGRDPDSPDNRVVAFEYFRATNGDLKRNYGYTAATGVTRDLWNRLDWVRVQADTTFLVLRNLEPTAGDILNKKHFFFVRAIDEAGAVEQVPVQGVNWVDWGVAGATTGQLTIRSNVMGSRITQGGAEEGAVFEGTKIIFSWQADLRSYGGVVTGYGWAYDNVLWSPWDIGVTRFPETGDGFRPTRGRHSFFARARDEAGLIVQTEFPFEVFAGPAEVETTAVFHWNDFFYEQSDMFWPGQQQYLRYWSDTVMSRFNITEQFNPKVSASNQKVPIRQLSRATTLLLTVDDWEGDGGAPFLSNLVDIQQNPIWSYVDAGGNLLLVGFRPTWNFLPDNDYIDTGFIPIPDPCSKLSAGPKNCGAELIWWNEIVADSIPHPVYEYCAVDTTVIDDQLDYMQSAQSRDPTLPDLVLDPVRARGWIRDNGNAANSGLHQVERFKTDDNRNAIELYGFGRKLDPGSAAGELPMALFIPSNGSRGNVVIFGGPLWYFDPDDVKLTVETIMISLFGEEFRSTN
ncbi:MAG: hypothetical protein HKN20_05955 [Gemmatimonadetes bacterium]|nr:hypothetical protein [Gemmatimonadota bacterium]